MAGKSCASTGSQRNQREANQLRPRPGRDLLIPQSAQASAHPPTIPGIGSQYCPPMQLALDNRPADVLS